MSRLLFTATALLAASLFAVLLVALSQVADSAAQPIERRPTAAVSLPSLRVEYREQQLVLTGTVPDDAERRAIVRRAHAIYGPSQVVDQLQVAAVANPNWLSPAFLPDLRPTRRATVLLHDAQLVIDGEANTEGARAAVWASVAACLESGVQPVDRLRLADGRSAAQGTQRGSMLALTH